MNPKKRVPERRRFLQYAGALVPAGMILASPSEAQQAEIPTAQDAEGPFFVANTPVVENLNRFGKTGEPMRVVGRVMNAARPSQPVPGAKLELWQTDGTGKYYPEDNGDYSDYSDREIDMRGAIFTDTEGQFSVMSLFPAEYEPRPSHIHYWIRAEGFRMLVTQHYLDTDPGNRPHRTANVDRSQSPALFRAPTIYLVPE